MIRICLFSLLFICSFTWHSVAFSAIVDGLYTASVETTGQSSRQQKAAAKQALAKVLVKVSGNRQLLEDDLIKPQLNNAEDFLLSFRYERDEETLLYVADFDINKVESLIRNSGFPLWGRHRPQTLIWLAIEEFPGKQRRLLADNRVDDIVKLAKQSAQVRGIDIVFPVMDLVDIQQVSVYDVWSSFTQSLAIASERYGLEYSLSARMYFRTEEQAIQQAAETISVLAPAVGNVWVIEWILTRDGQFESGEVTALDQNNAIANLIETLADVLANKYAISAVASQSTDNKTRVTIGNVSSLRTYVEVMQFLAGLSMVVEVALIEQQGQKATFEIELFGARENLDEAFELERRLRRPSDSFGQPITDEPWLWNP